MRGYFFTCKDPNFVDAVQQDKTTKAPLYPPICIVVKELEHRVIDNQALYPNRLLINTLQGVSHDANRVINSQEQELSRTLLTSYERGRQVVSSCDYKVISAPNLGV